jgi:hypothetical protein
MEKEFTEWFEANEKRFAHGQFDEKQIAYSAWLEGKMQALRIHDVVGRSEQLPCDECVDGQKWSPYYAKYVECDCRK